MHVRRDEEKVKAMAKEMAEILGIVDIVVNRFGCLVPFSAWCFERSCKAPVTWCLCRAERLLFGGEHAPEPYVCFVVKSQNWQVSVLKPTQQLLSCGLL